MATTEPGTSATLGHASGLSAPTSDLTLLDGAGTREAVHEAAAVAEAMRAAVSTVIRGKPEAIDLALVALLSGGHLLVDDVPGLGKTSLARALGAAMGGEVKRLQFTPDMLPGDVTGGLIYNQHELDFTFKPGPIFANVVLADEINRASPKTQSALLEAMAERQVSVGGDSRPLPVPFVVLATQNPIEQEGTYRLPEAQLDRFLISMSMGYPDLAAEIDILKGAAFRSPAQVSPVTTPQHLAKAMAAVERLWVSEEVVKYVADVVRATRREHPDLRWGVSPRGGIALLAASRAAAVLRGRHYVDPEDVVRLREPVLAHRLVLSPHARRQGKSARAILAEITSTVPVPRPGIHAPSAL